MVFIRKREQRLVDDFLQRATADGGFALNIGSGNISYGDRCVNLDVFEGEHVDVVSPAAPLPFNDATFDGVMSLAVLEHVPDDRAVLAECQRVLKPGGLCLHAVPFMQGFHAVPDDYRRFTQSGLRELLAADFDIEATGVLLGPASSVAWLLREFFAILTSFGSPLLYNAGMLFWGWIFWPIKFLDLFLASHPFASQIASGVYILACKKDG
jgi:SAM-dependent methyltransferase